MIDNPQDVHAFADGELTGPEQQAVAERLQHCAESAAELENVQMLKALLRDKVEPPQCHCAWKQCAERIHELDKRRRAERFVSRYAWAMCGCIALVIAMAGLYTRSIGGSQVATGDVARMVAGLAPFSQRGPSPSVDLGEWLREVSEGAPVADPKEQLLVETYSRGFIDGRHVTIVNMRDVKGPITLAIVKGVDQVNGVEPLMGDGPLCAGRIDQVNCVSWTDRGFSFILAGNRSYDELGTIANAIRME